ncbi:hypothetical protein COU76_04185 [Candidatus Peregrinibacteria bacterium CG10_big_fil_rev_8_21_14_0_10_49_10]|nr:MAG: hypothetical protein COU76_04185 [Candidatus Peregrinibacteria bacterium CG10_big_fil_rev_8_21_14_0_10_49_10]
MGSTQEQTGSAPEPTYNKDTIQKGDSIAAMVKRQKDYAAFLRDHCDLLPLAIRATLTLNKIEPGAERKLQVGQNIHLFRLEQLKQVPYIRDALAVKEAAEEKRAKLKESVEKGILYKIVPGDSVEKIARTWAQEWNRDFQGISAEIVKRKGEKIQAGDYIPKKEIQDLFAEAGTQKPAPEAVGQEQEEQEGSVDILRGDTIDGLAKRWGAEFSLDLIYARMVIGEIAKDHMREKFRKQGKEVPTDIPDEDILLYEGDTFTQEEVAKIVDALRKERKRRVAENPVRLEPQDPNVEVSIPKDVMRMFMEASTVHPNHEFYGYTNSAELTAYVADALRTASRSDPSAEGVAVDFDVIPPGSIVVIKTYVDVKTAEGTKKKMEYLRWFIADDTGSDMRKAAKDGVLHIDIRIPFLTDAKDPKLTEANKEKADREARNFGRRRHEKKEATVYIFTSPQMKKLFGPGGAGEQKPAPRGQKKESKPKPEENKKDRGIPPDAGPEYAYTIQPGDTLETIALQKYGSRERWEEILETNENIRNPNLIFAGQTIHLPHLGELNGTLSSEFHTVASGETLSDVAKKYYGDAMLWPLLYEANKSLLGANPDLLSQGVTLQLPKKTNRRPEKPMTVSKDVELTPRDLRYLEDLQEDFRPPVTALLQKARAAGLRIVIVQGHRSYAEQETLYGKGRITGGPKVTNAQPGHSWHNFGYAVDFAFEDENGRINFDESNDWQKLGEIGRSIPGLKWGGDFRSFKDRPHFQFDKNGVTLASLRKERETS